MGAHEKSLDMLREIESLVAERPGTPISTLRALRRKRIAAEQSRSGPDEPRTVVATLGVRAG